LRNRLETEQELNLETDSDEAILPDSEVSFMKILGQQVIKIMQLEAELKFVQDHNIHGILVVSILSLQLSVD
jgi:hypothetical protein